MRKKIINISLLLVSLMISITVPIIAVTAKKKEFILSPIRIDDSGLQGMTWEEAAKKPWVKGSGTEEDPYMIKNVVIDAGGNFFCMFIMNSEAYFKIMDSTFSNTGPYNSPDGRNAAVILVSTTNGEIFKNEIFGCGIPGSEMGSGIALVASSNNKLQKNFCHDIELCGIYLQYSSNNIISQNLCTGNIYGILIGEWSNGNQVTMNECYDNEEYGILLWTESNGNLVTKNECKRNLMGGITVSGSHGNVITDNFCSENQFGIIIAQWSTYNEITNNDCSNNNENGIHLWVGANNNLIANNVCKKNSVTGVVVGSSHGNDITSNLCSDNGGSGIAIVDFFGLGAESNLLYGNELGNNFYGIFLSNVHNNDVFENNIKENALGINLGGFCQSNIIYHNNIIDNTQQAYDNNLWSNNWNGNYWSDYPGVDLNGDSIGDTDIPWLYDYSPFVEKNIWDNSDVLYNILYSENRIRMGSTVFNADMNYIVLFLGQSISERRDFVWDPPYTLRILIDDEDIELNTFWWNDKEGELLGEPFFWQVYYNIFEPDSLGTGPHSLEYIYTYYNGAGPYREQILESMAGSFNVE